MMRCLPENSYKSNFENGFRWICSGTVESVNDQPSIVHMRNGVKYRLEWAYGIILKRKYEKPHTVYYDLGDKLNIKYLDFDYYCQQKGVHQDYSYMSRDLYRFL